MVCFKYYFFVVTATSWFSVAFDYHKNFFQCENGWQKMNNWTCVKTFTESNISFYEVNKLCAKVGAESAKIYYLYEFEIFKKLFNCDQNPNYYWIGLVIGLPLKCVVFHCDFLFYFEERLCREYKYYYICQKVNKASV